ncbi:uncharacterized protein LOC141614006 isoform X2 [Silene latifolia]|uniref:uncharacterized protein LOC141614006 isoform X2 n=1 Tax=Silene latifolia TaxID=37657 RepID=UPI003D780F89
MSLLGGAKVVAGTFKNLVVDRIVEYLRFIKSYEDNMIELRKELKDLCAKKLDLDAKVMKGKQNLEVMTRQTANWLENVIDVIEGGEMKMLMKEKGVAEIVVKVMERNALKNLWQEDRELFDIVINVVKNKCSRQEAGDREVLHAEEDADYKKVAKVASEVMKDIAEEFTKFIQSDDAAAVAVVKLLNDEDLKKLTKDGDEMAIILSKAEGVIRNKIESNNHDEKALLLPKDKEDVQTVDKSIMKENVGMWRKHMGSLMSFMDDDNFKKGLPDGAKIGLEVMDALSKSSRSDQVEAHDKQHRYCGSSVLRFEIYRHRHDMSQIAQVMVNNIRSMILKYPSDPVTRDKRDDELDIIPGEFADGLESREVLVRKILIALKDDQVNIVGVYGMGGCGKTTLAKEVAYKRVSDLFSKRVVVEVSEVPNIKGIQNQIAGGVGLTLDDMNTTAQRARRLYNRLKSEKILIILDNIWKKLNLEVVGIPRESSNDSCCKLLITTREKQVCSSLMDVQESNIFKVGLLNQRESLNLFENKSEKNVGSGVFKLVADRLLMKCGGLPLTIAMTASSLKGKNLSVWRHFAETSEKPISSQVSSEYRETYSILETSYKFLDIEEKRTFLFLACLSPLDSAVTVKDLMRYGIGFDLFQRVNGLSEAMEQACTWANELILSSLLLEGDSEGEVKIHDLVRASIIAFVDKDKDRMTLIESIPRWMCEETFEKFTAISLMSGHDFSRLSGVKAPILEILLLKGDVSSTTLPSNFFEGMANLKVLSLSNINFNLGLPESMGQLDRLKTLHLHYCKLKDVKLIGKLVNLLVLSLRGSTLEELAVEIGELYKLRLLDIEGCKGMKRIPANILSRLSNLEGLYMLNGFDDWASTNIEVNDGGGSNQASGSELDTLRHLNVLEMEVSKIEQLLTVNNGELIEQLGKFKIRVRSSEGGHEKLPVFRYVLELIDIDPSVNSGLRVLLKKTECLVLRDCNRLTKNVVPELDENGFKDLKYLKVQKCDEVKFIMSSNEQNESMAFANLEILELLNMKNLEMICANVKASVGVFSNLRRLNLTELPNLECGLSLTSVLLNLNEVSVNSCPALKFFAINKDAKNETEVDMFPYLKTLRLLSVQSLSSVMGQSGNEVFALFNAESKYPSLERLLLYENDTIQTLWSPACYVSGFQNLKALYIIQCTELRSLGPPSIFAALVQLENLEISRCNSLREVIGKEIDGDGILEKAINFPKLKKLSLESSMKIERFYRGSYSLKFPNLKSLCLSNMGDFTNFDGTENSTTLFSDKIEFPRLEELNILDVQSVSNEVLRLWNWSSSVVQGESESGSISFNPVPNLQILRLGNISLNHGLLSIPQAVSHKLSNLDVNKFNNIKSLFSVSAVNEETFCTYSQLPNLKTLSVRECESLEQLFDGEDDDVVEWLCESLIVEIILDSLPKLKIFSLHFLKNICTLSIFELSWKYVFSADLFIKGKEQLQLLETLNIGDCKNMEVIIKDELVGDREESVYIFPRLKTLNLFYLNITKFTSKPNTEIQFPSLEVIQMGWCNNIESVWSELFIAPKLKTVKLEGCDNMQCFLSEKRNEVRELPFLKMVKISKCSKLLSFSSAPLVAPKLNHVILDNCPEMKWFLRGDSNNNDIVELPSLEIVTIKDCYGMESFLSGEIKAPKLCELEVDKKDYSKCANEELQYLLMKLPNYHRREEKGCKEEGDDSDGEMEELRNDGSEGEQNAVGGEELEELRTQGKGNDKSQEEQSMEGDLTGRATH